MSIDSYHPLRLMQHLQSDVLEYLESRGRFMTLCAGDVGQ